jgi:hypothetical protein
VKYADGSQKVVFVEPHGMRNDDLPPSNGKVDLYLALKDLSDRIAERDGPTGIFLDSYIISATPYEVLKKRWGGSWVKATRERFAGQHVLFEDDLDAGIPALLAPRDELEHRISTSYPYLLAHGYGALMRGGDPRDLYKEQLRFAENILAFLASVSLALLRKEDLEKTGLDLKKHWSGGISPGDWREIIQRCSKVFADYKDVPLAAAIRGLKIGSEQKGFGRDVIELIRAKNDYKHDRGPTDLEEIANASDEAQERLGRCMQALAFFADYPIRRTEGSDDGNSDLSRTDDLSLDLGGNRVSLYPFIVAMNCSKCDTKETFFVDAWDRSRNLARLKSFERGHAANDSEVADALSRFIDRH